MHRKKNVKDQIVFVAIIVVSVILAFITARFLPIPDKAVKLCFFLAIVVYTAVGVLIMRLLNNKKRY